MNIVYSDVLCLALSAVFNFQPMANMWQQDVIAQPRYMMLRQARKFGESLIYQMKSNADVSISVAWCPAF